MNNWKKIIPSILSIVMTLYLAVYGIKSAAGMLLKYAYDTFQLSIDYFAVIFLCLIIFSLPLGVKQLSKAIIN